MSPVKNLACGMIRILFRPNTRMTTTRKLYTHIIETLTLVCESFVLSDKLLFERRARNISQQHFTSRSHHYTYMFLSNSSLQDDKSSGITKNWKNLHYNSVTL